MGRTLLQQGIGLDENPTLSCTFRWAKGVCLNTTMMCSNQFMGREGDRKGMKGRYIQYNLYIYTHTTNDNMACSKMKKPLMAMVRNIVIHHELGLGDHWCHAQRGRWQIGRNPSIGLVERLPSWECFGYHEWRHLLPRTNCQQWLSAIPYCEYFPKRMVGNSTMLPFFVADFIIGWTCNSRGPRIDTWTADL